MDTTTKPEITAEFWSGTDGNAEHEGTRVDLEIERDEGDSSRVSIHTFLNGEGSITSYYVDREHAIRLAHALLGAAMLP